jgi:hypothetical protein
LRAGLALQEAERQPEKPLPRETAESPYVRSVSPGQGREYGGGLA